MHKAYSYVRFSTLDQRKGNSYERQKKLCEKYAEENGLILCDEEFFDEGISAFKGANKSEDKALGVFINAVELGKINKGSYLLVESLDRISRETSLQALETFTGILKLGIVIVTLLDNHVYTYEKLNSDVSSLLASLFVMARAHEESETKSKRISKAWEAKRSEGGKKVLTAKAPAWLKVTYDYSGFIVDEEKVKIINQIFDMVIDGHGVFFITNYLNKNNIKPFGMAKIWHMSYVRKILLSKACIGEYQPHRKINNNRVPEGDVIIGYFPEIVTPKKYYQAQEIVKNRGCVSGGRKGQIFSNIFTHVLFCELCGSPLVYINKGAGKKAGSPILKCRGKHLGSKCRCGNINYKDFEDSFFRFVYEVDLKEILTPSLSNIIDIQGQKALLNVNIGVIDNKLLDIQKSIADNNLFDSNFMIMMNNEVKRLNDEKKIDQERIDKLDKEMLNIEANSAVVLSDQVRMLKEATYGVENEKVFKIRSRIHQNIIQIVDRIEVYREDIKANNALSSLPAEFVAAVKELGYSELGVHEMMKKAQGRKLLSQFNTIYIIHFKNRNNKKAVIQPFIKYRYSIDSISYQNNYIAF